jgi:hypothetical protein
LCLLPGTSAPPARRSCSGGGCPSVSHPPCPLSATRSGDSGVALPDTLSKILPALLARRLVLHSLEGDGGSFSEVRSEVEGSGVYPEPVRRAEGTSRDTASSLTQLTPTC